MEQTGEYLRKGCRREGGGRRRDKPKDLYAYIFMTHGHRLLCGEGLRGWVQGRRVNGEKTGISVILSTNTFSFKNKRLINNNAFYAYSEN